MGLCARVRERLIGSNANRCVSECTLRYRTHTQGALGAMRGRARGCPVVGNIAVFGFRADSQN